MKRWRSTTLGELLTVRHGYAFKGEYFSDQGREVVLTPGNFPVGGGLQFRDGKERYYSASYPPQFTLTPGDLLVVMTDLKQDAPILGSPAFVPQQPPVLHNQRLGLVQLRKEAETDRRFMYYLLLCDTTRSQLRATATGSTVRHTAPERIYQVQVDLPPLECQRRIGEILGGVDDLIENNRRRIELLEQMAQSIYREWFVHFRYPGHENVPLVESRMGPIPEGWVVGSLGLLAEEVRQAVKPSPATALMPYVPIDAIHPRSLTLRNSRPGHEAASSLRLFEKGDLLFGAMRAYFHKVCIAPFRGVTRSTCFVLRPNNYPLFTAMTLTQDATIAYAAAHSSGSTIPYAKWAGVLSDMPTVIPPADLADAFEAVAAPLLQQAQSLVPQAQILERLRDLLLPKLVTGEIDVSGLDLDAFVESVA